MPVSSLSTGERRMEAGSFLASGYGLRASLELQPSGWMPMAQLALTWQPSRLTGIQVGPKHGTPFLAATQVFDVRPSPRKWLSLPKTEDAEGRFVRHGTILLTCSGSVGRAMIAGHALDDTLISHDILRIEPNDADWKGWLYAYLRAPTVRAMMTAAQYGHIIKHLEVGHIDDIPVVLVNERTRKHFSALVDSIVDNRDKALAAVIEAENLYGEAIGGVARVSSGAGYVVSSRVISSGRRRLDGYMQNPSARAAETAIVASGYPAERLVDLVKSVTVPGRFKHVYGPQGMPYLDSAQILEGAPDVDKRVLSLDGEKRAGYLVEAGTLLIPCSGQVHGIIGSVVLAAKWHEDKVLTNHILRIAPKSPSTIRFGYLQQVLSHPTLGKPRVQRSAFGSSVPELSPLDVAETLVPRLSGELENQIADLMERATRLRAEADELEEQVAEEAEAIVTTFISARRMPMPAE